MLRAGSYLGGRRQKGPHPQNPLEFTAMTPLPHPNSKKGGKNSKRGKMGSRKGGGQKRDLLSKFRAFLIIWKKGQKCFTPPPPQPDF